MLAKMTLGERIKYLREKNGYAQKFVAEKIGVKNNTLSSYEADKRQPDYDTLQKIADFFEVSIDYLLGRASDSSIHQDSSGINVAFSDGLKDFDKLEPEEQEIVMDTVADMIARFKKKKEELRAKKKL